MKNTIEFTGRFRRFQGTLYISVPHYDAVRIQKEVGLDQEIHGEPVRCEVEL